MRCHHASRCDGNLNSSGSGIGPRRRRCSSVSPSRNSITMKSCRRLARRESRRCEGVQGATARASRRNRARSWGSSPRRSDANLRATMRCRRVSRALYTSPMPPAPASSRSRTALALPAARDMMERRRGQLVSASRPSSVAATHPCTARRRAARASKRVESSVGNGEFESSMISGISVQPRITASQPSLFHPLDHR